MKGFSIWIGNKKTKSGKRYYVCWRLPGNIRGQEPVGPYYSQAVDVREKKKKEFITKNFKLVNADGKSVKELVEAFLRKCSIDYEPSTVRIATDSLKPFKEKFGSWDLNVLTLLDLEDFRHDLVNSSRISKKGKVIKSSPNGVAIRVRNIKECLSYAATLGWITKSPADKLKEPKKVDVARFLTYEEKEMLLDVGCKFNEELKEIIFVALHTGMRMGEILSLSVKDIVDMNRIRMYQPKTDKWKTIPIHAAIMPILMKRLVNGKIFRGWNKGRLECAFHRSVLRSKIIGRLRFHDLRHTFASDYLQGGGTTLLDLQKIMGVTLQTLQIYAHFQREYLSDTINKIEFVRSGRNAGRLPEKRQTMTPSDSVVVKIGHPDLPTVDTASDGMPG